MITGSISLLTQDQTLLGRKDEPEKEMVRGSNVNHLLTPPSGVLSIVRSCLSGIFDPWTLDLGVKPIFSFSEGVR